MSLSPWRPWDPPMSPSLSWLVTRFLPTPLGMGLGVRPCWDCLGAAAAQPLSFCLE